MNLFGVICVCSLVAGSVASARTHNFRDAGEHNWHADIASEEHRVEANRQSGDELTKRHWLAQGEKFVADQVAQVVNRDRAKNVIFFIGDGMSIPTVTAARVYAGGEHEKLAFEKFPHTGMVKTYCLDYQVPDSACTATAYLTGVKGNYGTIGVNGMVKRSDCDTALNPASHTASIAQWAIDAGKYAGLVTTTRVTHASPAGVYAHTADRDWESDAFVEADQCNATLIDDIAEQLVHGNVGSRLRVILGGGRREFRSATYPDEEKYKGQRTDDKNLIDEWLQSGAGASGNGRHYVWNRTALAAIDPARTDYLLGLFEGSHLQYNLETIDRGDQATEPTLTEMVDKAIDVLAKSDAGFFLFVEGGKIDLAHHDTKARMALDETIELSKAVEWARAKTNVSDTLIVVSSDHAHAMSLAGYANRGADIFRTAGKSYIDNLPYMTLSYANGPGFKNHIKNGKRVDPTILNSADIRLQYPATVPMGTETHGGDDVGVYASGPWSHLFSGVYEQSALPHLMAYAACIGTGLTHCQ